MRITRIVAGFVAATGLLLADLTPDQRRMDFMQLATVFWKQYGPYEWKKASVGFDLANLQPWLDRVAAAKSDLDYLEICHEYANSNKDGHVFFRSPSFFRATAPIETDVYDGKVMVEAIDVRQLPANRYPIRVGDEILTFDGQPVDDVVKSFYKFTGYGSNERSERRYAADFLFFRPQQLFPKAIELGDEAVVVVKHGDGTEDTVRVPWTKLGEPFRSYGTFPSLLSRSSVAGENQYGIRLPEGIEPWERGMLEMGHSGRLAEFDRGLTGYGAFAPSYTLPVSFVLRRGSAATDPFVTGTFTAGGKRIGYIRLPNMSPPNLATAYQILEQEIAFLQENTDGLVIDVMRNTGGFIIYGHEVARRLIPNNFAGVGFELRATAARLAGVSNELEVLKAQNAPAWAIQHYENTLSDIRLALSENRGRTGPLPLNMPSLDVPPANVVYTKPLIVLIDEFSISTADLFPALIQDNGRGPLVGWRTGGLGGTNGSFSANALAEGTLGVTFGLMVRPKAVNSPYGMTRYIENVGVSPDIELDIMTRENLLNGGRTFVTAFTNIILDRIGR